jgi:hypothetical protein
MIAFFGTSRQRPKPTDVQTAAPDEAIKEVLRFEQRARSMRFEIFDDNVINDSIWPLLQDLFAAHLAGVKMRTKELQLGSRLPLTTVLRYLDHLEKFDIARRGSDPLDHRVTLVSMTESGAYWMRQYYSGLISEE